MLVLNISLMRVHVSLHCLQHILTKRSIRPSVLHHCYRFRNMARDLSKSAVVTENGLKPLVGVCQMTSTADKEANFATCLSLMKSAKARGVQMLFFPEACDYIAESKLQSVEMAEGLDGDLMSRFCQAARENGLWLSIGGFHQKGPKCDPHRVQNTHVIIDSEGQIKATYCKTHLFDLDLKGRERLCESDYTVPGQTIVAPVATPVGNIALSVCYDMRFPELSMLLARQGAQILTYPSAFTQTTGMAHWEVLLRARAIENQCYVIAAAQTGKHNAKRTSYGHAMVVDPWGCVVAQCREGTDMATAEIDLAYLARIREDMPVQAHRRHDLYSELINLNCGTENIDNQEEYTFGHVRVKCGCVFARTSLSFAFVNIKPVLPGHMLVASLRPAERFSDLTQAEVSDLFTLVQKVSNITQEQFGATSLTVTIQDGSQAGQTVKHVHVHILPRKLGDFEQNDDVYLKLEGHDKNMSSSTPGLRTEEQMAEEAALMRLRIRNLL